MYEKRWKARRYANKQTETVLFSGIIVENQKYNYEQNNKNSNICPRLLIKKCPSNSEQLFSCSF